AGSWSRGRRAPAPESHRGSARKRLATREDRMRQRIHGAPFPWTYSEPALAWDGVDEAARLATASRARRLAYIPASSSDATSSSPEVRRRARTCVARRARSCAQVSDVQRLARSSTRVTRARRFRSPRARAALPLALDR